MPLADLAPFAGVTVEEAARLHQAAALEVHRAMMKAVA
jgi:hypothetical protein